MPGLGGRGQGCGSLGLRASMHRQQHFREACFWNTEQPCSGPREAEHSLLWCPLKGKHLVTRRGGTRNPAPGSTQARSANVPSMTDSNLCC